MDSRTADDCRDDASDTSSPRLIGKRLCIDRYIYTVRNYHDTSASWECRRYRNFNGSCPAKAITSNPTKGEKLIVRKGPKESKHNHPPSDAEIEEAEMFAKLGIKTKTLRVQSTIETPNGTCDMKVAPLGPTNLKRSVTEEAESDHSIQLRKRTRISDAKQYCTTKRRSPLSSPDTYRIFLLNFMENPVFDRKSVIEALRSIYKSENGCTTNFATILENQSKIEQDLKALKNDLNIALIPLHVGKPNSSHLQESDASKNIVSGTEKIMKITDGNSLIDEPDGAALEKTGIDEIEQTIPKNSPVELEVSEIGQSQEKAFNSKKHPDTEKSVGRTSGGVPPLPATIPSGNQLLSKPIAVTTDFNEDQCIVEKKTETTLSSRKKTDGNKSEMIPPVPAAVPIEVAFDTPPTVSTVNSTQNGQEIEFIDLTDDSDENQDRRSDQTAQGSVQENAPTATSTLDSSLESNTTQTAGSVRSNPTCEANHMFSNVHIQSQNQYVFPNFQGNWYDPNMNRLFDGIPENLSFNSPYLIGDVQVPLLMNLPNVGNDGASFVDHLFAQIQVFRQTASFPQFQEFKS